MNAPARPPLQYFGGKWRIAPWIIAHFPRHDCYVEPFGGGASVLLRKAPAPHEVYNDLDGEVVNFFRVLREQPDELIRLLDATPWARAEYELSHTSGAGLSALERARRFYVRSHQSIFGGRGNKRQGWHVERPWHDRGMLSDWNAPDHLVAVAARLKRVQLDCDDAFAVIARFDAPGTLYYLDPPYVRATRSGSWPAYRHELDDDGHRRLAALLHGIRGMAVISGYPSALYDELYAGWQRRARRALNGLARPTTECLWLSPAASARLPQRDLFAELTS